MVINVETNYPVDTIHYIVSTNLHFLRKRYTIPEPIE